MAVVGIVLGVAGALLSLAAAVWLLVGFNPDDERYSHGGTMGGRHPGVGNLLRDQNRVGGIAVAGAACQLAAILVQVAGG